MDALFWMVMLAGMALIVRIRFGRRHDESCDFCSAPINTSGSRYIESRYAVEMGDLRGYSSWYFCSEHCELLYLEELLSDSD